MKYTFSKNELHTVTEANINYYAIPFVHPRRIMQEHDFIYLLEGEWKLGQSGNEYHLKKDTLLILNADEEHYGITPCLPETKTMYFHVSKNKSDGLMSENLYIDDKLIIDKFIDASDNKNIKHLFFEVVNAKLSGDMRRSNLYFELLLCELEEHFAHSEDISIANKIKNVIHSNPERFFSNKELAEMMNVSVKTAENKFKLLFGKTIHRYMLDYKIKEAMSYFDMFPEMSIKEAAYNLGFYDEYHFSKQFKRVVGVSPYKYKKGNKVD